MPIGYVISIVGTSIYLKWLGVHRAAMEMVRVSPIRFLDGKLTRDEAIVEANSTLLAALRNGIPGISLEGHCYIRDWIRRRMDVVAINFSLIVATLLAGIIALVIWVWQHPNGVIIPLIISILVILAMICNMRKWHRGVVEVIAGIYRAGIFRGHDS